MKTSYSVTLAAIAGFGLGAVAIEGLHAQAKPPIYYVAEIDVSNQDGYMKEYAPKAQAAIRKAGGRFVAVGSKITALEGPAPKRVALVQWDSLEKLQAWRNATDSKALRKVGDKYAKFRTYAIEGVPQQ
jgi:uncharacterized protein (DUF1330 family)